MRLLCNYGALLLACVLLAQLVAFAAADAAQPKMSVSELRSLADAALTDKEYTKALSYFTQLIALEPKSQLNFFKRSSVHMLRRNHKAAIDDLTAALQLDPKFVKGYMQRASVHKSRGDFVSAKTDLEAVLRLRPNQKAAAQELQKIQQCVHFTRLAEEAMDRRDYQSAKQLYTNALEISHDSMDLMLKRAECEFQMAQYYEAVADTGIVLKQESSNIEALRLRARAYYMLGELEVAQRHLKEGLRQDPEHQAMKAEVKRLRALLRHIDNANEAIGANDHARAVDELRAALSVDPAHMVVNQPLLIKKCQSHIKLKNWDAAVRTCSRVLEHDQNSKEAFKLRAEAHLGAEQFEEAVRDYQRARQIDPNDGSIQDGLRQAEALLKRSKTKDLYKILGLARSCDAKDIKKAYRKLALQYHPDRHTGSSEEQRAEAEKQFKEVANAYEILSNPEMRAKYDRGEDVENPQPQQQHNPFQHFGGQHFGGGGGWHFQWG